MKDLMEYVNNVAEDLKKVYEGTAESIENDGEKMDFYEYFNDALDIEYMIGYDGEFRGVEIAVTLGGPNVYINTRRGEVVGFWGTDKAEAWIPSEICEEINSIFEENYSCIR